MAFQFERPDGFAFTAGQAVDIVLAESPTLQADALRHTFSVVSAPQEEAITVATRMRDSEFKRALNQLPVGAVAGLEGPFGCLTMHSDRGRAALFIAGGIGVTPFMSMLRQAARDESRRQLVLLYSNHRPEDSAWLAELRELEQQMPDFRLMPVMTAMNRSSQSWAGLCGRIDAALIRKVCAGLSRPVCYVAGSPNMVASMRPILNEAGVDDDDIRSEEFHGY
ncbi:MAG: ferredoxin--NADP reductase [Solimonas sp.]